VIYRALAIVGLTFALVAPAAAQGHHGQHPPRTHGPDHVRPDSASHAAIHALLHGSWEGTFHRANETPKELHMMVARDSAHGTSLVLKSAGLKDAGPARGIVFAAGNIQWTQQVRGATCTATARVDSTAKTNRSINGKLACPTEEIAFTLRRQTQ
jgi:hypothetical protein